MQYLLSGDYTRLLHVMYGILRVTVTSVAW